MSFKINLVKTGRDMYFNPNGNADFDATSVENSVDSPTTAIARINDLDPIPSGAAPASINAAETGTFSDGITIPDFVSVKCAFASIISFDSTILTVGNQQTNQWGAFLTLTNDSTAVVIDGKARVAIELNALVVGSDIIGPDGTTANIGFEIKGACDDIFVENRQMEMRGDGAIGFEFTATSETPARIQVDSAEFFNRDQIFFHMNSTDALEEVSLNLTKIQEAIDATKVISSSCVVQVVKGIVTVTAHSLVADNIAIVGAEGQFSLDAHGVSGDLTIETGGFAQLRDIGVWAGDIIIESGATLNAIILTHIGTITNNGILNGIINGVCFGTFCDHPEILTSEITGQVLVSKNTGNVIISGEVQ